MDDQSTWPEHLRDDAPYLVCSHCQRKSWAVIGGEKPCRMPQPSGKVCSGILREPVEKGDGHGG